MGLRETFLDIFYRTEPPPPPPLGPDMVGRREYERLQDLYAWAIRDKREEKMRADCYEAELIMRGATKKSLASRVELYKAALKADVRKKAARAS